MFKTFKFETYKKVEIFKGESPLAHESPKISLFGLCIDLFKFGSQCKRSSRPNYESDMLNTCTHQKLQGSVNDARNVLRCPTLHSEAKGNHRNSAWFEREGSASWVELINTLQKGLKSCVWGTTKGRY